MDKLKLIRENEEQFKKHLQDIQNLEIQQKEQDINNMILQSKQESKKQYEAEKYLLELRQKSSAENSGLINKNINNNSYQNNKLHENLNNFVFNQIYDDSDDDFGKEDNVQQYNINDNELENKNNIDYKKYNHYDELEKEFNDIKLNNNISNNYTPKENNNNINNNISNN